MGGDRYVHLFLVVIISQCTHISKHCIVYLKYIQFSFAINKQTNKMETGYCQGSGPFLWACFPASLTLHRRGRLTQGMAVGWAYVCVAASGGPYVVLSVSVFQTSARSLSLSFAFPYLSVSLSLPVFCDRSCFDSTQQKGRLTQKDSEKKKKAFVMKSPPPQGVCVMLLGPEASREVMESTFLKVFRGDESH